MLPHDYYQGWDDVPELAKATLKDTHSLALTDYIVTSLESPSTPTEALDCVPFIIVNITANTQDSDLQGLLVEILRESTQPRVPNWLETKLPSTLIDLLLPLLGTLTNRGAIGNGIAVVTSYKILQSGNAVAEETLAALNAIQSPLELCFQLKTRGRSRCRKTR